MTELTQALAEIARLTAERDALAQGIWDARAALGFDNDGDRTPGASIAGMGYAWFAAEHVREAKEQSKDYSDLLDLWDGTERRDWIARAEAAEALARHWEERARVAEAALAGKNSPYYQTVPRPQPTLPDPRIRAARLL